jgi:hypothetical protein
MILLRICGGKREDALNQVLAIVGLEDGYSVSNSWVEVQFFRRPGILNICRVSEA